MTNPKVSPIFFVGAPRSGTTVIFEEFAKHPEVAWISNYSRYGLKFPPIDLVQRLFNNRFLRAQGHKNQFSDVSWYTRLLPRPVEAYSFWNALTCEDFSVSYLLGRRACPESICRTQRALARVARYQGKPRIAAKLTGPGRIGYLSSIFPDAHFVNVIRDGFRVVCSLLNVGFWREKGGLTAPWWQGGLTDADRSCWEKSGYKASILAAVQWRRIVETTRAEGSTLASGRYIELRYEDFLSAPSVELERICEFLELEAWGGLGSQFSKRNHHYEAGFSELETQEVIDAMKPLYSSFSYPAACRLSDPLESAPLIIEGLRSD